MSAALEVSIEDARRRLKSAYDLVPDHASRPLVLFGCGPLGRRTSEALAASGRPAVAFADNNAANWGNVIDGIPVVSPQSAVEAYGENAIFVVTIYNGDAARTQLRALGCRFCLHFANIYHGLADILMPWFALADPAETLTARADISYARQLWADEESRSEFDAQIAWRLGSPGDALTRHDQPSQCYFPEDLFDIPADRLTVDCGAFEGDTFLQVFTQKPSFGAYLALEPDPQNYHRLDKLVKTLPANIRQKVTTRQCAVSSRPGILRFDARGSVASGVDVGGKVEVEAVTLDELLADRLVGLIKMDIEGGEFDALQGARKTLIRDRPILAISAYHKPSDIWNFPQLIRSIVPDYNLYLRRYAQDCWELVCYAVHPSSQSSAQVI